MQDLVVELRVVEKRFRGNAADVETCSAKCSTLFYAGDLQSFLSGLDGSDISSNSTSNDDQVLFLCACARAPSACFLPFSGCLYNTYQQAWRILCVVIFSSAGRMCFGVPLVSSWEASMIEEQRAWARGLSQP